MNKRKEVEERVLAAIERRLRVFEQAREEAAILATAAEACAGSLSRGGRVYFCGNGGSAAQADHLAAELVGRFRDDRPALDARALVMSGAALTAIANDYGYEAVFTRQIEGAMRAGDVLVALTTSGTSPNVVSALGAARRLGGVTILFTGRREGGRLPVVDHLLRVPSAEIAEIQELHLFFGHLLCEFIETAVMAGKVPPC